MNRPYLIVPDLQIPFEHENALKFCLSLKRHYRVPDENIYCVGDETDQHHGGLYPKNPNALHSPLGELNATRQKLREWYAAFPEMKLATSNHGLRWLKKASAAEIPAQLMRTYREVIDAPPGWRWQDAWVVKDRHPFRIIHGLGYSGMNGHRNAAIDGGISTVIGHLHAHAGISYVRTEGLSIWGMNAGCLVDVAAYAFDYGKWSRFKPALAAAMVFNGGSTPVLFPLDT